MTYVARAIFDVQVVIVYLAAGVGTATAAASVTVSVRGDESRFRHRVAKFRLPKGDELQ